MKIYAHTPALIQFTSWEGIFIRRIVHAASQALLCASVLCMLTLPQTSMAQRAAYPSKPIKLIVAYPSGGGTNAMARLLAEHLSKSLGPMIVENRTGAGGRIGAQSVARAEPDGYTLFFAADAELVIAPVVIKSMPYDPIKDFAQITTIASVPYVLAVHPDVPVNSVSEFIEYAKANPNKLNHGMFGQGSATHLLGEQFNDVTGIRTVNIAFAGSGPQITALLGGHVHYAFLTPLSLELVKAGKLKALSVTSRERLASATGIPTMIEAGLQGFRAGSWYSLHAPAGTHSAIIERIRFEVTHALQDPNLIKAANDRAMLLAASSPSELTQFMQAETDKWQKLANKIGLLPD